MTKSHCPSCGAPIQFLSAISLTTVCGHCRVLLIRRDLDLKTLGKVAQLKTDDSRLTCGATGVYKNVSFVIVGRVQMKYDGGYWSEWHLSFSDGRSGWLSDSMGEGMISFKSEGHKDLPPLESLIPGGAVLLGLEEFSVKTMDDAVYYSAEGELPDEIPLGEETTLVDLIAPSGRFATLDYSDDPPAVYIGDMVRLSSLQWNGLGFPA